MTAADTVPRPRVGTVLGLASDVERTRAMWAERAVRTLVPVATIGFIVAFHFLFLTALVLPACGLGTLALAWAVHAYTAGDTWRWNRPVRVLAWFASACAAVANVAASVVWFASTDFDDTGKVFPAWYQPTIDYGWAVTIGGFFLVLVLLVAVWPSPAQRRRHLEEIAARYAHPESTHHGH